MKLKLLAVIVGSLLGVIGTKFLFVGSALSLIPWTIVGLFIGYLSVGKKDAVLNGCLYGFFLAFVFMFSGYEGSASIVSRIPFFAILGLVGAVCGIILSFVANIIKNKFTPSK